MKFLKGLIGGFLMLVMLTPVQAEAAPFQCANCSCTSSCTRSCQTSYGDMSTCNAYKCEDHTSCKYCNSICSWNSSCSTRCYSTEIKKWIDCREYGKCSGAPFNCDIELLSAKEVIPGVVEMVWDNCGRMITIDHLPPGGSWEAMKTILSSQARTTFVVKQTSHRPFYDSNLRDWNNIWSFRIRDSLGDTSTSDPIEVENMDSSQYVSGVDYWADIFDENAALLYDDTFSFSIEDQAINRVVLDQYYSPKNEGVATYHRDIGITGSYRLDVQMYSYYVYRNALVTTLWVNEASASLTGLFDVNYSGYAELRLQLTPSNAGYVITAGINDDEIFNSSANANIPAPVGFLLQYFLDRYVSGMVVPHPDAIYYLVPRINEGGSLTVNTLDAWIDPPQIDFQQNGTSVSLVANALLQYTVTKFDSDTQAFLDPEEMNFHMDVPLELSFQSGVYDEKLSVDFHSLNIGNHALKIPKFIMDAWKIVSDRPLNRFVIHDLTTVQGMRVSPSYLWYVRPTPAYFQTDSTYFTAGIRIIQLCHQPRFSQKTGFSRGSPDYALISSIVSNVDHESMSYFADVIGKRIDSYVYSNIVTGQGCGYKYGVPKHDIDGDGPNFCTSYLTDVGVETNRAGAVVSTYATNGSFLWRFTHKGFSCDQIELYKDLSDDWKK